MPSKRATPWCWCTTWSPDLQVLEEALGIAPRAAAGAVGAAPAGEVGLGEQRQLERRAGCSPGRAAPPRWPAGRAARCRTDPRPRRTATGKANPCSPSSSCQPLGRRLRRRRTPRPVAVVRPAGGPGASRASASPTAGGHDRASTQPARRASRPRWPSTTPAPRCGRSSRSKSTCRRGRSRVRRRAPQVRARRRAQVGLLRRRCRTARSRSRRGSTEQDLGVVGPTQVEQHVLRRRPATRSQASMPSNTSPSARRCHCSRPHGSVASRRLGPLPHLLGGQQLPRREDPRPRSIVHRWPAGRPRRTRQPLDLVAPQVDAHRVRPRWRGTRR